MKWPRNAQCEIPESLNGNDNKVQLINSMNLHVSNILNQLLYSVV